MEPRIYNREYFDARDAGVYNITATFQAIVDAAASNTMLSTKFVHREHFGEFFLPEVALIAAIDSTLDTVFGRVPELGRSYRSLTLRDILLIRGEHISIIAISQEMFRHLPTWDTIKWKDFFQLPEDALVQESAEQLPKMLEIPHLNQVLIEQYGFVRPRVYAIPSVFIGAKDSKEEMKLRDTISLIATNVFEGERERIEQEMKNTTPDRAIPSEILTSLDSFRADFQNTSKTAFLMMRFGNTRAHSEIVQSIRETVIPLGISALRADDREYHEDLYYNVLTYIYGCDFGIAVFERIEEEEFNPNVSLEVGCMFGLRKPVCLLKDRTLKTLQTDLMGKLYREFDPQDPRNTIPVQLQKWLRDKGMTS